MLHFSLWNGVLQIMVDVTELTRVSIVPASESRPRWQKQPRGAYNHEQKTTPKAHKSREVADHADILGIPPGELTPAVQSAITGLFDELEHERHESNLAHDHATYLEDLADRHPFLPVLSRRTLIRELGNTLARMNKSKTPASFLILHVRNAGAIRRKFGRPAMDAFLAFVAQTLNKDLRATDILGCIGGADFGIILNLADKAGAIGKGAEIIANLESRHLAWDGHPVPLKVVFGIRGLTLDDEPDAIIDKADENLIFQEERLVQAEARLPWEKE